MSSQENLVSEFNALVEQIIKRNNSRPFPEINDIPK